MLSFDLSSHVYVDKAWEERRPKPILAVTWLHPDRCMWGLDKKITIWWHFLSWFVRSSASTQGTDLIPSTDFEVCQRRKSLFSWLSANQPGGLEWMNLPQRLSGHNARQPQGDFRAPKLLTHPQFALSKSHWTSLSASGVRAPVCRFYCVSSSNPRHAAEIQLHLEASANTGWTRGSGWEREDGGGERRRVSRRESAALRFLHLQPAEVVIRPFRVSELI